MSLQKILVLQSVLIPNQRKEKLLRHHLTKRPYGSILDFRKDNKIGNSGKLVIENKATCKLCFAKVARSGGTTNLHNHLRSHHREEYNSVIGDVYTSNSDQTKISDFCKHGSPTTKLPPNSKRAQELTAAVVEFVVPDLKPIRVVVSSSDGCRRT